MQLPIYLDYHATTPCDPQVVEAMLPFFSKFYGNPSSRHHAFGTQAGEAIEIAREQVAALIGAQPKEIIFTGCATESNNLAIRGVIEATGKSQRHVITVATEHHSVLESCKYLERFGHQVTILPVDRHGLPDLQKFRESFRAESILASVMMANNEIGTIAPMAELAAITHEHGALLHSDLAQATGKIPIDVKKLGIDLASIAAHKIYGPKGVGALYIRSGLPMIRPAPQMLGGGQERQMRSGTYNVPGIVGLGKAAQLCRELVKDEAARIEGLRNRLFEVIKERVTDVVLNGHPTLRLPGNLNISLPGVPSEMILGKFRDELAISSGAACTSATSQASHVLHAIGLPSELIHCSLRFGIGRFTRAEEITFAAQRLGEEVQQIREYHRSFGITQQTIS